MPASAKAFASLFSSVCVVVTEVSVFVDSVELWDQERLTDIKISKVKSIGYIFFDIITYYNSKPIFNIMALGVKKEYQKLGIGRNLLKEIINYFNTMYYFNKRICNLERKIYLQVRCSNESAKHLYSKVGFKITKVINNFYEEPSENGYEMIYNF